MAGPSASSKLCHCWYCLMHGGVVDILQFCDVYLIRSVWSLLHDRRGGPERSYHVDVRWEGFWMPVCFTDRRF